MNNYEIYCLKCKRKTGTKNVSSVATKNNRYLIKGLCEICDSKKSNFVSKKKFSVIQEEE